MGFVNFSHNQITARFINSGFQSITPRTHGVFIRDKSDVVGWYRADSSYSYYGKKNGYDRAKGLVREAIDAAEAAGIDFSIYDNDNDGYVDGIILAHAVDQLNVKMYLP